MLRLITFLLALAAAGAFVVVSPTSQLSLRPAQTTTTSSSLNYFGLPDFVSSISDPNVFLSTLSGPQILGGLVVFFIVVHIPELMSSRKNSAGDGAGQTFDE